MPQEFCVVRCIDCNTFQVDIVKKATKWNCKLCNKKQSYSKTYFKGSAKECRESIHELRKSVHNNERKESEFEEALPEDLIDQIEKKSSTTRNNNYNRTNAKWQQFKDDPESPKHSSTTSRKRNHSPETVPEKIYPKKPQFSSKTENILTSHQDLNYKKLIPEQVLDQNTPTTTMEIKRPVKSKPSSKWVSVQSDSE